MLSILSNRFENASRLSENLQYYWNAQGVYASVSLFEDDVEFCKALSLYHYKAVILQSTENMFEFVSNIRNIKPNCKIVTLIDSCDSAKEAKLICNYRNFGVEMVPTCLDLEKLLEMITKQLCIV